MIEANPTTRATLLKLASPLNYQTKTGRTTLSSVNSESEIMITGQNKRFWVTDFVPLIYNSDGTIPDGKHFPIDDILVDITIGTMQMTDRPMPLFALLLGSNDELFSGKIIEPNSNIVFKIVAKHLGSMDAKCKYPITIYITLKGYDLPNF